MVANSGVRRVKQMAVVVLILPSLIVVPGA